MKTYKMTGTISKRNDLFSDHCIFWEAKDDNGHRYYILKPSKFRETVRPCLRFFRNFGHLRGPKLTKFHVDSLHEGNKIKFKYVKIGFQNFVVSMTVVAMRPSKWD